ncbi:MAG: WD40/YVTN/BNR-like repeat-containing protein [Panacagrimonas sp.]
MSARTMAMFQHLLRAIFLGSVLIGAGASAALAQDDAAAAADADEAPSAPISPRPAEIARLSSSNLLLGVTCAGKTLVAVGDRGNILLSTDGKTWKQVQVPVNVTLTAVAFADARNGWAVGHDAAILHTVDGGNTWTLQQFKPEKGEPLLNVIAIDAQHAFGVGAYGMFLQTADGGATWTEVAAPALRDDGLHLNSLVRLGDGSLFVVGETGLAGASADNGVTWERLAVPYEGSLFGALPRGEKGALVFGLRGNVLITDDVRTGTWTPVDIGSVQSMFGGTLLPDGRAVLVGADGVIVYVRPDGTAHRATSTSGSLSGVVALAEHLQIVGETGVGRVAIGN